MFLDRIEKPIQELFVFVKSGTFVESLPDVPIGGVQYFHSDLRAISMRILDSCYGFSSIRTF